MRNQLIIYDSNKILFIKIVINYDQLLAGAGMAEHSHVIGMGPMFLVQQTAVEIISADERDHENEIGRAEALVGLNVFHFLQNVTKSTQINMQNYPKRMQNTFGM